MNDDRESLVHVVFEFRGFDAAEINPAYAGQSYAFFAIALRIINDEISIAELVRICSDNIRERDLEFSNYVGIHFFEEMVSSTFRKFMNDGKTLTHKTFQFVTSKESGIGCDCIIGKKQNVNEFFEERQRIVNSYLRK